MLNLLSGLPGCGKTSAIFKKISFGVSQKRRQILVVPETRSHEAERQLLLVCTNRAAEYAEAVTFTKMAERVFAQMRIPPRFLDAGGKVLLLYRALQESESALTYYRTASKHPESIKKFLSLFDELKAGDVSPKTLLDAVVLDAPNQKLKDIALIYSVYSGLCAQGEADIGDKLRLAAEAMASQKFFEEGTDIYIDGFDSFTGQEYRLMEQLFCQCQSCTVTLTMGEDAALYSQQIKTNHRLEQLARRHQLPVTQTSLPAPSDDRAPEVVALTRDLYRFSALPFNGPCSAVARYSARDEGEECRLIAALARQLMLSGKNVRLREIMIACPAQEYGEMLEAAFAQYEVPLFIGRRRDVLQSPPVLAALGAFELLIRNLDQESVFRWFKSGLSPVGREEWEALENYVYLWGVRGEQWFSPWVKPACGFRAPSPEDYKKLNEINLLRNKAIFPLETLKKQMKECHTGGDFARLFLQHMETIGLEERLNHRIERMKRESDGQLASEYAQLYRILFEASQQFEQVMKNTDMDLSVFVSLMRLTLSQYQVSAIPASLDCVQLGDFDRLSFDGVKTLFVAGARDGIFPPSPPQNSLLGASDRIFLEGAGVELAENDREQAFLHQSKIERAFSKAQSIVFTAPEFSIEGNAYQPSFLLTRISRLLPQLNCRTAEETLETLAFTAPEPALAAACAPKTPECLELSKLYFDSYPEKAKFFTSLKVYNGSPRGPITNPEYIRRLYGDEIRLTASRVEKISSCRFSYFMQYGLKAVVRKAALLGAPEIGSFIHAVVELSVKELSQTPGASAEQVVQKYTERFIAQNYSRQWESSPRLQAIFAQLGENARGIVENVLEEIRVSRFKPLFYELDFSDKGDIPPLRLENGQVRLTLSGKIDRVDGCLWNETLYLKVSDYKTGEKTFHLSDLLEGANLQMFLYLLTLKQNGSKLQASDVIPCAALYIPAKSPYVPLDEDEDPEEERKKELKRLGVVLNDGQALELLEEPEDGKYRFLPVEYKKDGGFTVASSVADPAQFYRLLKKTEETLYAIAADLARGDVEANPYQRGSDWTSCNWCDFRAACQFDVTMEKDKYRRFAALKDWEVHRKLEEEYDGRSIN